MSLKYIHILKNSTCFRNSILPKNTRKKTQKHAFFAFHSTVILAYLRFFENSAVILWYFFIYQWILKEFLAESKYVKIHIDSGFRKLQLKSLPFENSFYFFQCFWHFLTKIYPWFTPKNIWLGPTKITNLNKCRPDNSHACHLARISPPNPLKSLKYLSEPPRNPNSILTPTAHTSFTHITQNSALGIL